jgi:hypothetical protein
MSKPSVNAFYVYNIETETLSCQIFPFFHQLKSMLQTKGKKGNQMPSAERWLDEWVTREEQSWFMPGPEVIHIPMQVYNLTRETGRPRNPF